SWNAATAIDRVVLDAQERHRRRITLTGERGTAFLLDLPQATALKDGDGLVLEDGAIVRVAGKAPLRAQDTISRSRPLIPLLASSRSAEPTANACLPRSNRSWRRQPGARWPRSTRGCSGVEAC